jgi:alkanesulfonate monooxygenase SsuD/methylene tetrahydromethanopterin reductase-like flavin-dependent oxidoreductase (luciferase family)
VFTGQYVQFDGNETYPKPLQNPVPIFMAGEVESVFRRLARFGQGWIDYAFYPEALKQKVDEIRRYVREAHGKDSPVEIARQFFISLAPSKEEAEANRSRSAPPGKSTAAVAPPHPMETTLVGAPADIAARLREYADAGVTEVCAIFFSPDAAGAVKQMELFAREVIPAVEARSTSPSPSL